ncbi:phosphatidylethanolamine-binding protein [Coniella lustricola]|uniref:Phosphatidylethanolamine-binding protein n=1 Tax=Coniella lustricola TaxID=2025994 RepID=A0A2T3AJI0_9PEZI|nr:phosphatidylethanolamine-binding protein [Coniella lustricola]
MAFTTWLHAVAAFSLAGSISASPLDHDQQVLQMGALRNGAIDELKKAEIIPSIIDAFLPSLLVEATWSSSTDSKASALDGQPQAELGNTLRPKSLQDPPTVTLKLAGSSEDNRHGHDSAAVVSSSKSTTCALSMKTTYVLALTDPDAPSRNDPKWFEFCHWIATGLGAPSSPSHSSHLEEEPCVSSSITFSPTTSIDAATVWNGGHKLDDLIEYKPPSPPEKTGKHRYVFLVFVPANGTTEGLNLSKPGDRQRWGYDDKEVDDNGRVGVGKWARENGLVAVGANFIYAQNKKQ